MEVFKHDGATIELLEAFPCASLAEAKARERHWTERTPQCVNKTMPGHSRVDYKTRDTKVAPLPPENRKREP